MDAVSVSHALESRMLEEIPLARQIGVRVLAYDGRSLVLAAPLAGNSNDKGTAFGGSLYSVAVLAGWGLLALELESRTIDAEIVIHEGRVEYLVPIAGDFIARARTPDTAVIERSLRMLQRYGRARLEVAVVVEREGVEAVRFNGSYVLALAA